MKPFIQILYSTQTGTSKDIAEYFWKECLSKSVAVRLNDVEEFDIVRVTFDMTIYSLRYTILVYVFYSNLQDHLSNNPLSFIRHFDNGTRRSSRYI